MGNQDEADARMRIGNLSDEAKASELMDDFLDAIRSNQMGLAVDCWQEVWGHAERCDLPLGEQELKDLADAAMELEGFSSDVSKAVTDIQRTIREKRVLGDTWDEVMRELGLDPDSPSGRCGPISSAT